jgi:E2/UBC family protein C/ThiF family protein
MALADYYERAALAASQVIAGFEPDLFRKTLDQTSVGLGISREAAKSNEGRVLADLTVRLLARLYPLLELRVESSDEAERLTALARAINPRIEITRDASVGISIGIGSPAFDTTYFAGSNGWDAFLSSREPVPTGSSQNPFGAGVAACLAAANLFNRVLIPNWEQRITGELLFSTFHRDRKQTPEDVPNDSWELAGDAVLVGLGAVGNGAVWALAMSSLAGTLHVVDPEVLELSNLQRYVLGERSDEGRSKVELAKSYLRGPLKPMPHQKAWAEFVRTAGYDWPHVLVALDTAADRRSVQASLPKWIANSWTQPGDLGLSVHGPFDGPGACLSCLYLPDGQVPNEDEVVARALAVPGLVNEIRTLLHTGQGLSRQLLEAVAAGLALPVNDVLLYEGRPVRDLYVEGVCGGGLISLGSTGTPRQELHVPLAHQSALAGVLLAGALVRRSLSADVEGTMITRIDILGAVSDYLTQPALKGSNGLCICEDSDYLTAFRAKYAPHGARSER